MLYWLLKYVLLGPFLRLLWPTKVYGLENIPEDGGVILASNHLAVADSFFLPCYVPRRVTFLAKREYFEGSGVKGALQRWFFSGTGQFPIDRSSASAAQAALDTSVRLLQLGHVLGIYPEGTRSPDGRLYKGKSGLARMVLESEAPVVPVAMLGTERVNPIGSRVWRPRKLEIRIGAPLDFRRYAGLAGDRFVERAITDEVMYALMELSGQEYVDIYATRAKELAEDDKGKMPRSLTRRQRRIDAERFPQSRAS